MFFFECTTNSSIFNDLLSSFKSKYFTSFEFHLIVSEFIKKFLTFFYDFDESIDSDDFDDFMIETCVAKIVFTAVLMTCNIVEFNYSVMTFFCELLNELSSFDFIVEFRYFVFACLFIDLFNDKRNDLNSNFFVCE